ncbi:stress responsive alpha/beta barrel protein [Pontibacter ummariensis]|uniref:Stress responsive A/B Barrel Domain n=1 Tax=Pontibacter ummariensis TaxID=1610492 RepID=A0A239L9Z4_9BACT|nr:Dabb family protein [Pontibacter ummariensis]PRY04000.1 stress responsive alpha/beta barrel protein [Pontibacter ummariensis]SNT26748.1 Stress responsive A/B Barrel Domain [Pontibacter ummariensis]
MKKLSRRSFLGNSTFLSVAGLLGFAPLAGSGKRAQKGDFVHHVYFWLKNPGSKEDKAKLIEGLNTLKAIKQIQLARIGEPAPTNRDVIEKGYDVSWLLFFDNLEDEEIYQKHPVHLKFVENYSHLWDKVIVYDSVDV